MLCNTETMLKFYALWSDSYGCLQTFSDLSFKVGNSTNFYSMFENLTKLIKMLY